MQAISDASEVTGALKALSDASGAERLVALGVDKREADRDPAFRMMTMNYGDVPLPVRQMILAAGDIVYDFDIAQILKSVYATSDNDNIGGFAPFRDFFANHTIVFPRYTVCVRASDSP